MEINEKKLKEILKGERQEFQKYVDTRFEKQRKEFQKHTDNIVAKQREEFQNHTGALAEEFQSQTQAVAEQYSGIKRKLDSHTEMIAEMKEGIDVMKDDIVIIKKDVEVIKDILDKKVDHGDFVLLERRVLTLETK